jgi:hypothetical protein
MAASAALAVRLATNHMIGGEAATDATAAGPCEKALTSGPGANAQPAAGHETRTTLGLAANAVLAARLATNHTTGGKAATSVPAAAPCERVPIRGVAANARPAARYGTGITTGPAASARLVVRRAMNCMFGAMTVRIAQSVEPCDPRESPLLRGLPQ